MTICSSDPQIDSGRVNKVWTRLFRARLISKQPEKNWDNMIYHDGSLHLEDLHRSSVLTGKLLNLFPFSYEGTGNYFLRAVYINPQRRNLLLLWRLVVLQWWLVFKKKWLCFFADVIQKNNKTLNWLLGADLLKLFVQSLSSFSHFLKPFVCVLYQTRINPKRSRGFIHKVQHI